MKEDLLKKIITVSQMYFEEELTQEQISEQLGISVSQISRLIARAKSDGYISIKVIDPFLDNDGLRGRLLQAYPLKDARVVEVHAGGRRVCLERAAQAAADYLADILHAGDIVGVAFSDIVSRIPAFFPRKHIGNACFVQLGGVVSEYVRAYQNDTIRSMASMVDGLYYFMPAPALVKDRYVRDSLHDDPVISWVLETAAKANIAVYGVCAPCGDSPYIVSGYLTELQLAEARSRGAVGEIYGHFLDKNGALCMPSLEERLIGLCPSELAQKDYSICAAVGAEHTDAVRAVIKGGYCNVLITDSETAGNLLE